MEISPPFRCYCCGNRGYPGGVRVLPYVTPAALTIRSDMQVNDGSHQTLTVPHSSGLILIILLGGACRWEVETEEIS